jgi:hypothetical protein
LEGCFEEITTTLAQVTTAELNVHLEDSVSTKTSRRSFRKSNTHNRAAITEHLVAENNGQMRK